MKINTRTCPLCGAQACKTDQILGAGYDPRLTGWKCTGYQHHIFYVLEPELKPTISTGTLIPK